MDKLWLRSNPSSGFLQGEFLPCVSQEAPVEGHRRVHHRELTQALLPYPSHATFTLVPTS